MVRNCYKEIFKLKEMLDASGIPYTCEEGFMNGVLLAYPNKKNRICTATEHDASQGREDDTISIMGLLTAEESAYNSVGYLTAEDVFSRIQSHYESQ